MILRQMGVITCKRAVANADWGMAILWVGGTFWMRVAHEVLGPAEGARKIRKQVN
jgi:hypothetical protein